MDLLLYNLSCFLDHNGYHVLASFAELLEDPFYKMYISLIFSFLHHDCYGVITF